MKLLYVITVTFRVHSICHFHLLVAEYVDLKWKKIFSRKLLYVILIENKYFVKLRRIRNTQNTEKCCPTNILYK